MATLGTHNLVIGGRGNAPDGTLMLNFDPVQINPATFTYKATTPNAPAQTYNVTFAPPPNDVNAGTFTCSPPLNVPGHPPFRSGTMTLNLNPQTLTGTFSETGEDAGSPPVDWEADSGTGGPIEEATAQAVGAQAASQKY